MLLMAWREYANECREDRERVRADTEKSRAEAAEIQRDVHRKESTSLRLRVQSLTREVERYRGKLPPDMRLTQVAIDPTEPEG